jgi:hypothetical protein
VHEEIEAVEASVARDGGIRDVPPRLGGRSCALLGRMPPVRWCGADAADQGVVLSHRPLDGRSVENTALT